MLKIAVLGSTRGMDLPALLAAQRAGQLHNAEIILVISNRADAHILERAKQGDIETQCIESKDKSQEDFEQQLQMLLQRRGINFIVLIGFMKILSGDFVQRYAQRIINIHPSLLPKYAGGMNMDVHAEVLKNHDTVTGCTLHYVTEQVDAGPIILQKEVPVLSDDTSETLKARIQQAEQTCLIEGINQLAESLESATVSA